jgi:ferredoxin
MKQPRNPARAARRAAEARGEVGTDQRRCIYCGNTDPSMVRPRRIQDHHIFGGERDPFTAPACLNCHAGAHEHLRDAEVPMVCEKERTEFARAIFRLFAVHFSLLAEACWRFAKKMERK